MSYDRESAMRLQEATEDMIRMRDKDTTMASYWRNKKKQAQREKELADAIEYEESGQQARDIALAQIITETTPERLHERLCDLEEKMAKLWGSR
jgi:hypothetical protein